MPDWVELDPWAGKLVLLGGGRYESLRGQLTNAVDVGFHAVPSVLLVIDLLFLSPPWTITVLPAMGLSAVLAFGYWIWVEHCFRHNGW